MQDVAAWTFQESLALRLDGVTHHREGETEPRETYTTNDRVVSPRHSFGLDIRDLIRSIDVHRARFKV